MINLWNTLLFQPILNSLIWLYRYTGNLGWSIILLTISLRLIMTPLVLPSLRLGKKTQDLAPELAKLKVQFKDNKSGLMAAQAELYKKNGINPAAGCLPQILQIVVLIALFSSLNTILKSGNNLISTLNKNLYAPNRLSANYHISTNFYSLNLVKPDVVHVPGLPIPLPGVLLLLTALVQLLSSKMMMPVVDKALKIAEKSAEDTDDAMVAAQQQMLYMFPLMTIIFGFQFPSGLVIYWFFFSLVSMGQQYIATGWGGLAPWLKRLHLLKS